jgi:hypothetical protein
MNPSFLNLFMNILTRDRVVPIISASVSCDILGITFSGWSCEPKRASNSKVMFPMKHANHLVFVNEEHRRWCDRRRCRHTYGLACKAPFPEKIVPYKDGHNGFFAALIDHSKSHATFPYVYDITRGIALREDGFYFLKFANPSPQPGRVQEQFHIEGSLS